MLPAVLRLTGRTDGAADGQEGEGGDRSASLPHSQTQPGVCSCTPATWPFHQPWQDSLSQWETVLSLSLPGTAKSDKSLGTSPGPGVAPSYFLGSCCQPGGSRQQQDGFSPAAADSHSLACASLAARGSQAPRGTPALEAMPHFPCPAAPTAGPDHSPPASTAKPLCSHNLCCDIDPSVGGWGWGWVLPYSTDLQSESCISSWEILLVSL